MSLFRLCSACKPIRILAVALLFMSNLGNLKAQSSESCLSVSAIQQIYNGNPLNLNLGFDNNYWNFVANKANVPFVFEHDTLIYNLVSWRYTGDFNDVHLNVYYWRDRSNIVEYKTTEACFNALFEVMMTDSNLSMIPSYSGNEEMKSFQYEDHTAIVFSKVSAAQPVYTVYCYNPMQLNMLLSQKQKQESEQKSVALSEVVVSSDKVLPQDVLVPAELADTVKKTMPLNAVSHDVSLEKEILEKIDEMREDLRYSRIDLLTRLGESLYAQEEYTAANVVFSEILTLDPGNANARVRVAQTDAINKVILVRSSKVYDFKTLNPGSYKTIMEQIRQELNRYASLYPSGNVAFNLYIRFDTLGMNRSGYEYLGGEVEGKSKRRIKRDVSYFLRDISKSTDLTPTLKEGIMVSSKADLGVNMSWQTREIKVRSNDARYKMKSYSEYPRDMASIATYLDRHDHVNGRYKFTATQKKLDKTVYTDINLVKFKTVGPEAMLYSMLFPGAGSLAATQGQKGWAAFSSFIVFGGAGLATYFLSKEQTRKADRYPADSPRRDMHTANAEYLKYATYACVGVAGVIYVADVFTALGRGIKNLKMSKELRKALKDNVIDVQRESVIVY